MEFIYLIGKELKIQLKQLPIYLYMIIVVAFLFSQITFPDKTTRLEPIPVSEYLYEHIYKEYKSEEREVYNVLSLMKTGSKKLSQNEKKEVGAKLNSQEEFYMKDNKKSVILFLLQIGMAILINMIICFGFYKMLFVNGADFSFQTIYVSALLANVFIGLLANVLSHVIGDIRSGFLIAIAYYLLEFVTKGSITGLCYLFRPLEQNGNGYEILIFMIIGILFVGSYKRKEIRGERVS